MPKKPPKSVPAKFRKLRKKPLTGVLEDLPEPGDLPTGGYDDDLKAWTLQLLTEYGQIKPVSKATGVAHDTVRAWALNSVEALRSMKRDRAERLALALERALYKVIGYLMEDDRYKYMDASTLSVMLKNLALIWLDLNNPDRATSAGGRALVATRVTETEADARRIVTRSFEQWVSESSGAEPSS